MHQQSIESFFQVKKKLHQEISTLPSVVHYDSVTQMELEPNFEFDTDYVETATQSPKRKRKGDNQYSFSQEDMRLRGNQFTPFLMSNPFPCPMENRMNSEVSMNVSKNLESYFSRTPKKNVAGNECSMPIIEESPREFKQSKKYKDNHQFLDIWLSQSALNHYSWRRLPKEMMLRIMSYLSLKDNARIALVSRYFSKCYRSIWLSYEYFSVLNFQDMGSGQARQILEHGSRLPHIKQVKQMVTGKNPAMFFAKNNLKTRISAQFQKHESLFEEFSLKPAKPNMAVLITDKDIEQICESSRFSLVFVNLISCHLLTVRSFTALAACKNMQQLTIKAGRITDEDVEGILNACKNINKLCLSKCEFLTDNVINLISEHAQNLESLELSANQSMKYINIHKLTNLYKLHTLNLGFSCVTTDHFYQIFRYLNLKCLQVEGAEALNDSFVYAIMQNDVVQTLERLDISKNKFISEDAVWLLVSNSTKLTELNFALKSERIDAQLLENKSRQMPGMDIMNMNSNTNMNTNTNMNIEVSNPFF